MPTMAAAIQTSAPHGGQNFTDLVVKARAQDRYAFDQLIREHEQKIFRMIFARVRHAMDAQDLAQETFIRAFQNLHRLKEPEKFQSWLYSIALNVVRDWARKKKIRRMFSLSTENRPEPPDTNSLEAVEEVWKSQFWEKVDELSQVMSKGEREIFFLRFVDDLSMRQIAEVTGKSQSTVKTLLYRSLAKFKKDSTLRALLREATS